MKLTKQQKIDRSKTMGAALEKARTLFFVEFQGLKFVELAELRGKLRPLGCRYAVVKNSILRHALKNAGIDGPAPQLLKGPVGLVVSDTDDPVSAAKVLDAFSKQFPFLKFKAGVVERQWMAGADCRKLASLGTKPELLAKLCGTFYAAVASAPGVLVAPMRDLALALAALRDKKQTGAAAA